MTTINYGLNRHAGARADRKLAVPDYVESLRPGPDGYVDMTIYNERASWSGETRPAAKVLADELVVEYA